MQHHIELSAQGSAGATGLYHLLAATGTAEEGGEDGTTVPVIVS